MVSVYVMQNEFGLTKIGISSNVYRRSLELKNSSGIGVDICWFSETMDRQLARDIEKAAHERFQESRCFGEWFTGLDIEKVVGYLTLRLNLGTFKHKDDLTITSTATQCHNIEDYFVEYETLAPYCEAYTQKFPVFKMQKLLEDVNKDLSITVSSRDLSRTMQALNCRKHQMCDLDGNGRSTWWLSSEVRNLSHARNIMKMSYSVVNNANQNKAFQGRCHQAD